MVLLTWLSGSTSLPCLGPFGCSFYNRNDSEPLPLDPTAVRRGYYDGSRCDIRSNPFATAGGIRICKIARTQSINSTSGTRAPSPSGYFHKQSKSPHPDVHPRCGMA